MEDVVRTIDRQLYETEMFLDWLAASEPDSKEIAHALGAVRRAHEVVAEMRAAS